MPSKRRNNGRSKKNRGNTKNVVCINCGRQVGKDKAIKRFSVRDMIDGSSKKDIRDAIPYENAMFVIPKLYVKLQYCISCAIHNRIVRNRRVCERRLRPKREEKRPQKMVQKRDQKQE